MDLLGFIFNMFWIFDEYCSVVIAKQYLQVI